MLDVNDLCVSYGAKQVLSHVSFSLTPHRFTAVVGKNGCGKSTLCAAIGQRLRYTGEISYRGQSLALMSPGERARAISILPQVLPSPRVTVQDLVMFGRAPYLDFGKRPQKQDFDAVEEAICTMSLSGFDQRQVCDLSGGERQRAYLAMILAQQTRLVVLDEPATFMDLSFEASLLATLSALKSKHKKTLLVVMHNLSQAVRYADDILVMEDGGVRYFGSVRDCLQQNVIETVFGVKKHVFYEDGAQFVLFSP